MGYTRGTTGNLTWLRRTKNPSLHFVVFPSGRGFLSGVNTYPLRRRNQFHWSDMDYSLSLTRGKPMNLRITQSANWGICGISSPSVADFWQEVEKLPIVSMRELPYQAQCKFPRSAWKGHWEVFFTIKFLLTLIHSLNFHPRRKCF